MRNTQDLYLVGKETGRPKALEQIQNPENSLNVLTLGNGSIVIYPQNGVLLSNKQRLNANHTDIYCIGIRMKGGTHRLPVV